MKYSRALAIPVGIALLVCLSLSSSCSSEDDQNKIQTESKQSQNSSSPSKSSSSSSIEALVAEAVNDFAIWSRGRLAVSTGDEDDDLMFEVDPETGKTRAWGSLEVDGSALFTGNVRSGSLSTLGRVSAGSLLADDISVAEAEFLALSTDWLESSYVITNIVNSSSLKADELSASDVQTDRIQAGSIAANGAKIESLGVSNLVTTAIESTDASLGLLKAELAALDSLNASNASIADIYASSLAVFDIGSKNASINILNVLDADISSLASSIIQSSQLLTDTLATISLSAKNISGQNLEITDSISAESISADTINTDTISADAISADVVEAAIATIAGTLKTYSLEAQSITGTLSTVAVDSSSAGIVEIPSVYIEINNEPVDPNNPTVGNVLIEPVISSVAIEVPQSTDFVIASLLGTPSSYAPSVWSCPVQGNTWEIYVSYSAYDVERMYENGVLETPNNTIAWLAVNTSY